MTTKQWFPNYTTTVYNMPCKYLLLLPIPRLLIPATLTYSPWSLALLTVADCWEKHVVCLWASGNGDQSILSSPFHHPSIQRNSAGARWKPRAMIYGMSSPVELERPLPACRRANSWGQKPVPPSLRAWYWTQNTSCVYSHSLDYSGIPMTINWFQ